MSSGYIERINKVIDHYCISPSELAKRSGIDVSNFNKMLKGQQKITKQTLKKIADANNISFNWLYADEGNMLNSEQSPSLSPINDTVIGNNDGGNFKSQHTIKYYPNVDGSGRRAVPRQSRRGGLQHRHSWLFRLQFRNQRLR